MANSPESEPLVVKREEARFRSEEHTSELQSHLNLVCRLLLEKKKFPAAVEFIPPVVGYYLHHVTVQTACLSMKAAEYSYFIINGLAPPDKVAESSAVALRVRG